MTSSTVLACTQLQDIQITVRGGKKPEHIYIQEAGIREFSPDFDQSII